MGIRRGTLSRLAIAVLIVAGSLVASTATRSSPAAAATGDGYWLAAADGGVFAFGDAVFHGSMGGVSLAAPIVGMAATPAGNGYWLAAADGGVFAFGDARFHDSLGRGGIVSPVVGIAATPSGDGYWLAQADGCTHAFGAAQLYGPSCWDPIPYPVVAIAPTASGDGFFLLGAAATTYPRGDASAFTGPASIIAGLQAPITAATAVGPAGNGGLLEVASDGGVFAFSPAVFHGSLADVALNGPIVGIASTGT